MGFSNGWKILGFSNRHLTILENFVNEKSPHPDTSREGVAIAKKMFSERLPADEILPMLEAYRLGTKVNGVFTKFTSDIYSSREKIMSLLQMYAGMCITKMKDMKSAELNEKLLFHYQRLVRRFLQGYGLLRIFF